MSKTLNNTGSITVKQDRDMTIVRIGGPETDAIFTEAHMTADQADELADALQAHARSARSRQETP